MTAELFEVLASGAHGDLEMLGEPLSYNENGSLNYGPLQVGFLGEETTLPRFPAPPFLSATQPLRTEIDLTWTPVTQSPGTPPVTSWQLQRRSSTDNGASFGAWAAISGSPFAAATHSVNQTGLATGTPEVIFQYRAAAVNADGVGQFSNVIAMQWQGTPASPPSVPTNFDHGSLFSTHVTLTWSETPDSTVTKHGIYQGGTLVVDNIDKAATSFDWRNLVPGSSHNNVRVARANIGPGGVTQWSPLSNIISFTLPTSDPPLVTMMMGCSDSPNSHGGSDDWDGWRVYDRGAMLARANQTGASRPQFLAYSVAGPPLGTSNTPVTTVNYTQIFNYVKGELDNFYYGGAGQTHSGRWGIKLFWSNGNEMMDKGMLGPSQRTTPVSQANIDLYVTSQRALYDACHYVDPSTGQRRYPDAYAGSNPTHDAEKKGIIAEWLHPSARYHDFVMWSMYPPGRDQTAADPTYNYPSFDESQRLTNPGGYLIRCFYRTYQAQAQARIDTGDNTFTLQIGTGETGTGQDPNDSTTRPYYAVHALAGGMSKLSAQYGLPMPFACWWDNTKGGAADPQNVLSDEPASTTPSTRVAWQTWITLNHQFGGTHPASWANNPKPGWKTTGPVV